jgi:hypothetical protein
MGMYSGARVQVGNEHSSWTDYPHFRLGDGDGDSGVWLQLSMNRGNYGFQWNPEIYYRGTASGGWARGLLYGWFTLADDMVRVRAGYFGGLWGNYGTQAWNSADALGIGVEIMPIDGLNLGFVVRPTYRTANVTVDDNAVGPVVSPFNGNRLTYALGNTFFGARYAPAGGPVGVTVGLQLMSQWEDRDDYGGWLRDTGTTWLGRFQPLYLNGESRALRQGTTDDENNAADDWDKTASTLGVSTWVGVNLNVIDGLLLQIGARAYHLDDFAWSGHVWTNQRVSYRLDDAITVGMNMEQIFLTGKMMRNDFSATANPGDGPMDIVLRFVPNLSYRISGDTTASLSIPFTMAPGWSSESYNALALQVAPSITHNLGDGFSIRAAYDFIWNNQLGITDSNNEIMNRVQLTFNWSL